MIPLLYTTILFSSFFSQVPWDLSLLEQPPAIYGVQDELITDVESIYYDALPWRGKETRVFAYLGIPDNQAGEPLPAVVLAHGGGGTAYLDWVRLWNQRGYVAIAMDLEGSRPAEGTSKPARHDWGGPRRPNGFSDLKYPPADQWYYHAVADIILANSLLRSLPEVDPDRIGLTGISWGGVLASTVAGVDHRFAFVIPVYGCGFLNEGPIFQKSWNLLGPDLTQLWHQLWDPASYLADARMPMLWVNGSNDLTFPLSIHSKSFALSPGFKTLSIGVGMKHSHPSGWSTEEIHVFADSVVNSGAPLPEIKRWARYGRKAHVVFPRTAHITDAHFVYTTDASDWVKAEWKILPAKLRGQRAEITIPKDCAAWFFNLTDDRQLVVSTPVSQMEKRGKSVRKGKKIFTIYSALARLR